MNKQLHVKRLVSIILQIASKVIINTLPYLPVNDKQIEDVGNCYREIKGFILPLAV